MFDGHATTLDWNALGDMRRWSGKADETDWTIDDK